MPRMKALAAHTFDQIRRNPGDEYEATKDMAETVEKLEWAKRVVTPEAIIQVINEKHGEHTPELDSKVMTAEDASGDVESSPTRGRRPYRRRDMTAEG